MYFGIEVHFLNEIKLSINFVVSIISCSVSKPKNQGHNSSVIQLRSKKKSNNLKSIFFAQIKSETDSLIAFDPCCREQ